MYCNLFEKRYQISFFLLYLQVWYHKQNKPKYFGYILFKTLITILPQIFHFDVILFFCSSNFKQSFSTLLHTVWTQCENRCVINGASYTYINKPPCKQIHGNTNHNKLTCNVSNRQICTKTI